MSLLNKQIFNNGTVIFFGKETYFSISNDYYINIDDRYSTISADFKPVLSIRQNVYNGNVLIVGMHRLAKFNSGLKCYV